MPFLALLVVGLALPLFGGGYWGVIATRACVYWVLVAGLNLVVGFAGQIAIGWVALLTLGAYTTSVLAAGNVMPPLSPYLALAIAGVGRRGVRPDRRTAGAAAAHVLFRHHDARLCNHRHPDRARVAERHRRRGGRARAGFPGAVRLPVGLLLFLLRPRRDLHLDDANIAASRFGRALTAIRDAEVAAEASGISKPALLVTVFLFSGALAAIAGGLFASLQSYITPDAFTLDLSVLFFIAVLIGGRGSILGPLLGTILLTVLPEFAAPLVAWSTFLYAVLLLVIVLAIPGGIAELLDFKNRRPLAERSRDRPAARSAGAPVGGPRSGRLDA